MTISGLKSKLVSYFVNNPKYQHIGILRKAAYKITSGRFTPGLTIEKHRLLANTSMGDKIEIREDGFYKDNKWIAGNEYVSRHLLKSGNPTRFEIKEELAFPSFADLTRRETLKYSLKKLGQFSVLNCLAKFSIKEYIWSHYFQYSSEETQLAKFYGWFSNHSEFNSDRCKMPADIVKQMMSKEKVLIVVPEGIPENLR